MKKGSKKIPAFLLCLALTAAALTGCGGSSAGGQSPAPESAGASSSGEGAGSGSMTFIVSQSKSANHPYQKGCEMFADLVKKQFGDKFNFKIYPDGQLGSNSDVLESCQLGSLDMDVTDDGQLANLESEFSVLGLPFLFDDTEQVMDTVNGEAGAYLSKKLEDKGLVVVCWMENGFRYITNNKGPIATPADLKGIKIRVPTSDLYVQTFNLLGAQATPVDANELYSALQMGTVNAQENSLSNIIDQNLFEVQKYLSVTRHVHTTEPIVMSLKSWNKLTPDEQSAFLEAGKQVSEWSFSTTDSMTDDQLKELESKGMQINDDVDIGSFRKAVSSINEEYAEKYPDLMAMIKKG